MLNNTGDWREENMDEVVAGVGESPPASSTESYQANLFTVEDIIVLIM